MKLCLFWHIFTIASIGNFLDFLQKNSGNCLNMSSISQMGTRVHGSTSDELLTTFLPWTMRSRQGILYNCGWFCLNLVAVATPLAPLKIEIAYLKPPTPKTPPCTQKLCRYLVQKWSYAYLNVRRIFTIAGIGNFLDFAKNNGICLNILIKSQIGTRVHGSTSDEPLTTFLPWTMRSAGQVSKHVKK